MNAFMSVINSYKDIDIEASLKRANLEILQVNMGNLCNQSCSHCHIDASPQGKKIMSRRVIDDIIKFLSKNPGLILDITGGSPELNPHFDYFIVKSQPFVKEIIVRSNLTVFFVLGKEYLPRFFKENNIHLICSLPCYSQKNVDSQRGKGVFNKSIKALTLLNKIGYAKKDNLKLDIVYNPNGAYLPPEQEKLEKDYKHNLAQDYDIEFNRLITITNVPIKRFKNYLESNGEYHKYLDILKENFNPYVLENIMCRTFLSVGYSGELYDCDFNQALGWVLKDEEGEPFTIDKLNIDSLKGKEIMVGEHCLSCTAGCGSSCQGALIDKQEGDLDSETLSTEQGKRENIKAYYGKILQTTKDLKTNACCTIDCFAPSHKEILKEINPEILVKFYGCGSPIPPILKGCVVLDLGSGTGRDVYLASKLVGKQGFVIGVDMTDEQLSVARKYVDFQMRAFGFEKPNVEFKKGYIEDLKMIGIQDNSIDVLLSNCVINLSPDKKSVFSEIFRVLKPGGELYFSDIFAGRRIPYHLSNDPILHAECLAGALYIEDFRRILQELGCMDYRVVSKRRITLGNEEIKAKVGMIDFYSMTIRAFKLQSLEDICEDYGQIAIYLGTIPDCPYSFSLDEHHNFITNKPIPVCGNTASMLQETRYHRHFKIIGDRGAHFGPFDCKPATFDFDNQGSSESSRCC